MSDINIHTWVCYRGYSNANSTTLPWTPLQTLKHSSNPPWLSLFNPLPTCCFALCCMGHLNFLIVSVSKGLHNTILFVMPMICTLTSLLANKCAYTVPWIQAIQVFWTFTCKVLLSFLYIYTFRDPFSYIAISKYILHMDKHHFYCKNSYLYILVTSSNQHL